MSKLQAYVVRDATEGLKGVDKYSMVCMTELMDDGQWITGMNLITSLEAVAEKAEADGVPIYFESYLAREDEGADHIGSGGYVAEPSHIGAGTEMVSIEEDRTQGELLDRLTDLKVSVVARGRVQQVPLGEVVGSADLSNIVDVFDDYSTRARIEELERLPQKTNMADRTIGLNRYWKSRVHELRTKLSISRKDES